MNTFTSLNKLIELSKRFGMPDKDLHLAQDFLAKNELYLCFDQLITQLYEYGIIINDEFYLFIDSIGKKMNIPENEYSFLKELIR